MERSFAREVELLRLGAGEVFHGEGILAITKGLLQAGVSYVGGYQGAPVSHLLDVMVQARPLMDELGVKVEACSNEASAAALLGASIHYPVRGAVTWKSIVGTNVASDAVSNLSSPGVTGGALIIVGEDYGEGASVIQERSLAFALKSTLILFDPRPEHGRMVDMVERAFELSEASNMPAMMQLRIRACHVRGTFVCRDNVAPAISQKHPFDEPAGFDYAKLPHPPATFRQEKLKGEARITAARAYIVDHALNDVVDARDPSSATAGIGVIVQGGLYNTLMGALVQCGLADAFGDADVAMLVLNVTCPLAPRQIEAFCRDRTAVVVVEEGQPEFLEQEIATILRRAGIATALHGKDVLPQAGEYNVEIVAAGLAKVVERHATTHDVSAVTAWLADNVARRDSVAARFGEGLPSRPPGFCIGCPERPVFSALKQVQERIGRVHVAADIGCHSFATFEPFSSGHTILGYGMSLASAGGVGPMMTRRSIAIMGDGGFWHNGLLSGVQSALFNKDDTVLLILKNGYTSATGTQEIISTPAHDLDSAEVSRIKPRGNVPSQQLTASNNAIEDTLTGMGVKWLKTVNTYDVDAMMKALTEAFTTEAPGLKVIVGEGECQLERQRRIKPARVARLKAGKRTQRVKYGVDENTCSGDHSCIRLSGCPTLTLKDADDPLKVDPVVTITEGCVGCGLCGSNAHAATLCPSFYRIEVTQNPTRWDRLLSWMTTSAVARKAVTA